MVCEKNVQHILLSFGRFSLAETLAFFVVLTPGHGALGSRTFNRQTTFCLRSTIPKAGELRAGKRSSPTLESRLGSELTGVDVHLTPFFFVNCMFVLSPCVLLPILFVADGLEYNGNSS